MSKLSNLRNAAMRLRKKKWKRVIAIIRDYGFLQFLRKVREKMEHGTAMPDFDQRISVITNESYINSPSHPQGYDCKQSVRFTTKPLADNVWRVDILTQNADGDGKIKLAILDARGNVLFEPDEQTAEHNGYTEFCFFPLLKTLLKPLTFAFSSNSAGCGVLVNRSRRRHGFFVEGGGCIAAKIYMRHDACYLHWMKQNTPTAEEYSTQRLHRFPYEPKISIIVPLFNTPEHFLRQMIESVLAQTYQNWELCLADGSTSVETLEHIVKTYQDERILYRRLKKNEGISGNSNKALAMVTGEYIALLDHDDLLMPHALYANVEMINNDCDYEFIYSDEDKISEDGKNRFDPFFKPDFSPNMFHAFNYITHFSVIKKALLGKVGGFREEYNGAQDYDLFLRVAEQAKKIGHISDILYHWRISAGSTALAPEAKSYTVAAGEAALKASFARRGITNAHVRSNPDLDNYYITSYDLPEPHPLISVIIPNHNEKKTLKKCVDSILSKTTYDHYELIIVENNSTKKDVFSYYKLLAKNPRIRILEWNHPFNYSSLNNFAANEAKGEYLLFMNNDMSIISPDWMEQMLMHAARPEVGEVGAKLYYPDDTVQHAGIALGIKPIAGHPHKNFHRSDVGSFARLTFAHEMSAVTAACILLRAAVFHEVGGFDERFVLAYNDVDLSLKIREHSYSVVWTPFAELYHYESKTRGYEESSKQLKRLECEQKKWLEKWEECYPYDPFYNKNLTSELQDYSISPYKISL